VVPQAVGQGRTVRTLSGQKNHSIGRTDCQSVLPRMDCQSILPSLTSTHPTAKQGPKVWKLPNFLPGVHHIGPTFARKGSSHGPLNQREAESRSQPQTGVFELQKPPGEALSSREKDRSGGLGLLSWPKPAAPKTCAVKDFPSRGYLPRRRKRRAGLTCQKRVQHFALKAFRKSPCALPG
jgi:hypothetical protein